MAAAWWEFDLQVEISTNLFGKAKYAWRQCRIDGQRLQILDYQTSRAQWTLATPLCKLVPHKPAKCTYKLVEDGVDKLILFFPSATRRRQFGDALSRSSASPDWQLHVVPLSENEKLLAVANVIVETSAAVTKPKVVESRLTVQQVQAYVTRLLSLYNQLKNATTAQLYTTFLNMDEAYCKSPKDVENFACIVHKLYPLENIGDLPMNPKPLKEIMRSCPHSNCSHLWTVLESYQLHIERETLVCPGCHSHVNYEMFKIAAFIEAVPTFCVNGSIMNPPVPSDGLVESYIAELSRRVQSQISGAATSMDQKKLASLYQGVRSLVVKYLGKELGSWHVDLVQGLFQWWMTFVSIIGPNLDTYWSQPVVIQASVIRYQKFMQLHSTSSPGGTFSSCLLTPTLDIELARQAHQQDCGSYHQYHLKATRKIVQALDGLKFHGSNHKAYAETFLRWSEVYDEPYSSAPPSYDEWAADSSSNIMTIALAKRRWEKHCRVPSRECSYFDPQNQLHQDIPVALVILDESNLNNDSSQFSTPVPRIVSISSSGSVLGSFIPTYMPFRLPTSNIHHMLEGDPFLGNSNKTRHFRSSSFN